MYSLEKVNFAIHKTHFFPFLTFFHWQNARSRDHSGDGSFIQWQKERRQLQIYLLILILKYLLQKLSNLLGLRYKERIFHCFSLVISISLNIAGTTQFLFCSNSVVLQSQPHKNGENSCITGFRITCHSHTVGIRYTKCIIYQ